MPQGVSFLQLGTPHPLPEEETVKKCLKFKLKFAGCRRRRRRRLRTWCYGAPRSRRRGRARPTALTSSVATWVPAASAKRAPATAARRVVATSPELPRRIRNPRCRNRRKSRLLLAPASDAHPVSARCARVTAATCSGAATLGQLPPEMPAGRNWAVAR